MKNKYVWLIVIAVLLILAVIITLYSKQLINIFEGGNASENQTEESSRTVNKKIIPQLNDLITDSANSGQIQNVQKLMRCNRVLPPLLPL